MLQQITAVSEVWIGIDDGLIRQAIYDLEGPSDDRQSIMKQNTLIRYFDINKTIDIKAPVDSAGLVLSGWYQLN